MSDKHPLPRSVQEIADVIGRDAALLLVDSLPRAYSPCHPSGKVILYVPQSIRPDHHLVQLLGWANAEKLVDSFGGMMLQPAICTALRVGERDEAIRGMRSRGISVQAIAREFGITDRHVRNIVREMAEVEANDNSGKSAAA